MDMIPDGGNKVFKQNKIFNFALLVLLMLLIIYVGARVSFVFQPLVSLLQVVAVQLLLSVFFYHLLRPLVHWLGKHKVNRTSAILLIYIVFGVIIVWFIFGMWPLLRDQLTTLVKNAPALFNTLGKQFNELQQNEYLSFLFPDNTSISTSITDYLNQGFTMLTNYVGGLFTFVSNFAVIVFTFPIILFYMLKEGEKFGERIVSFMPLRFQQDTREIVRESDEMLSGFIVGRVTVNVALGVLMYIGFLIIGLPYALLLTIVAVIANFVPFIGAILSSVPIILVGLTQSPATGMWALVIILLAQQVQDNLIAPYIFGKKLAIHPLTTIILVLVSGDIGGIVAMIIIIPVYLIIKIVAIRVYKLFFKEKWQQL